MGIRTRGLDIGIKAKRQVADAAARAEAKAVIERWNEQLSARRDILWSPTIRAALIAGTPWLDVHESGNRPAEGRSSPARVGRHPRAGAAVLVVPGIGADAEDPRAARHAARGKGCGVEPVTPRVRRCNGPATGGEWEDSGGLRPRVCHALRVARGPFSGAANRRPVPRHSHA
jgi:hypothetical protein